MTAQWGRTLQDNIEFQGQGGKQAPRRTRGAIKKSCELSSDDSSLAYPGGTPEVLQEIAALMTPSVVGTAYGPIFFASDTLHEQIYGTLILNHLITLPICV